MSKPSTPHTRQTNWQRIGTMVLSGVGALVIMTALLPLGLIKFQGGQALSVQTGSMVPALRRGDLVSIEKVSTARLRVGDIITFRSPRDRTQTFTHRIVQLPGRATQGLLQTKGDANLVPDQPIAPNLVVGRVRHVMPKVGTLTDWVRRPVGLAIVIYLPALLIIGSELRRLSRYFQSQQPYVAAIRRWQRH